MKAALRQSGEVLEGDQGIPRELCFATVCGGAVVICCAHVDVPGMFTGTASILGHTTSPALAITGGGSIRVLQGFVSDVGIGV